MKRKNLKKPMISALEQRILFDGAAVATAVDVLDESSFSSNDTKTTTTSNDVTQNNAENSVHEAQAVQGFERDRREVAFVDVTVKDYQTLVDGVNEGVEVYLVSSLDEIKTTLSSQTNIDAIHILSHGNTGEISVGKDVLNSNTLDDNAQLLETMKNSLSVDGDILLYGCNVASDGRGQEFINELATLTQADVAASDDTTGNSALGGDWELEKNSGSIETDNFEIVDYDGKLVTTTMFDFSTESITGSGTKDSFIIRDSSTHYALKFTTADTSADPWAVFQSLNDGSAGLNTTYAGNYLYISNLSAVGAKITVTADMNNDGVFGDTFKINSFNFSDASFGGGNYVIKPNGIATNQETISVSGLPEDITSFIPTTSSNFDGITSLEIQFSSLASGIIIDNLEIDLPTAGDTSPPTFDVTPATSNVTGTTVDLNASLDEAGKIYYVVVADGADAPSIAQIKAGQDSTGASALKSGNSDVTATLFTGTYNITGLSANTAYDIYVVGQDDKGTPNVMTTAAKVDVTTAIASTAVGFTGDSGNTNSPNATVANGSQSSISITNTATNDTLSISTTGTNYYQDTATTFSTLGITPLSGGSGMLFYADTNTNFTNSITFTIQGNKVFDFNKILLQEINDETDTFTFTPNGDGSKKVTFSFNKTETKLIDLSSNTNFDGITSLTISTLDNEFQASFDNIEVENIRSASDTTSPTFDVAPATSNVTATTVDLSASLDEAGKIYYVVVADGADAPSIAQIKAGQDSTGASALKSGNSDVTATLFTGTYNITGLSANTAYDIYVVGQDDEGTPNIMASATKVDVTMAGLPPVFSSTSTTDFAENTIGTVYDAELSSSTGTVTYTLSGTDSGKFDINSTTGILTFKSAPDYETPTDNGTNNVYNVIIRATDNNGYTEQNVAINVTAVNEAPVITSSATVAIDENIGAGQVVYTVTSTDVDASATVTYSLSGTDASLFTIDSTSGEVTLIANPNFENKSSYSFNVIATDNGTLTDTQAVTLSINDVNEAPVITSSATVAIDENIGAGQVVYTVTSTDVDASATVTYSLSGTDASLFTIDSTTGAVTLIANPNFENKSSYSFNVIATDNGALTDTKAVTLAINDVNEAPVITSNAIATSIDENSGAGQVVYTVTSTDVDASATVSYSLSGTDVSLFTIDSTTGAVTLIANPNFENKSSYSFNVIATDNGALTDTKAVTLSINDVNEAPVITSSATVAIDKNIGAGQVVYTVTSTDVDASATVTYSLSGTDASLFTIDSTSGEVTLIANPNFENKSSYSFNVIATDNGALTDTKAVTLAINDVNDAPVGTVTISGTVTQGQTLTASNNITDADGMGTISYQWYADGVLINGAVNSTYTLTQNEVNKAITVVASYTDALGTAETVTSSATASVVNVNHAPTVSNDNMDVKLSFGDAYQKDVSGLFSDIDFDNVFTYEAINLPLGLTMNSSTGVISGRANSSGEFKVIIKVTDNGTPALSVSRTYNMLVVAPPQVEISQNTSPKPSVDNTPIVNVNNITISTFTDTLSLGTINNNLGDTPADSVGNGYIDSNRENNNQENNNQPLQVNRTNSSNYIEANASLNVGFNGQISFDNTAQDSFSIVGIAIENMTIENNRLEIRVVDTNLAQNFIVTQIDGTALPTGLSFDPKTGNISGTIPENLDKLEITIKATNPDGTTRVLNLKLDLKELKKAQKNQVDADEKYMGLKEQIALENQKLDDYGSYLTRLFA